jgi:nitric oxide dioxygenase
MTQDDVALIRHQFGLTRGAEEAFAAAFYDRLFQIAPNLREMFPQDMKGQGAKLMQVLAFAVGALDRGEVLVPAVRMLGQRHAGYGVTLDHFTPVGAALLDTLAASLGEQFDAQAKAAWTGAFMALVGMMADGMAEAQRSAA